MLPHCLLVLCALLAAAPSAQEAAVSHPFICCDNGLNRAFVVSAQGDITWEFPVEGGQDVWRLPNGNYLLSNVHGAQEVTPEQQVVWEYQSPAGTEVHTCQPLPDGRVMLVECGTSRIVEVDRTGEVVKMLKLSTATAEVHLQFRNARKLPNGHYLIACVGDKKLLEVDGDGHVVWEYTTPGNVFAGIRLPDGNTLIACGDGHKVIEIDPQGNVVWQIDETELPGLPLRFVAGLQRLPNGNTVVCNWGGHGHIGEQPLIFEVTRDKQVVWKVEAYDRFRTISGVQLLDIEGDVARGEVRR